MMKKRNIWKIVTKRKPIYNIKTEFMAKRITSDRDGYSIIINGLNHLEDITI